MKKIWITALICAMMLSVLAGCAQEKTTVAPEETTRKLHIVTTIFPGYDWVRQIVRGNENVELTMLLDSGVDLHSFQPTVADMVTISTCDVFVHVGGESDSWVEDALKGAMNPNMLVVELLDVLGDAVKEEEIVEGMEHDHEDSHDEDDHHEDDHDEDDHHEDDHDENDHHDHELDEHVWLSLKHAETLVRHLSEVLSQADSDNAQLYRENTDTYLAALSALDARYQQVLAEASGNTILFGDRFPFRYLADDYGLNYYAAFSGCSAETEASFETVVFLAGKVEELGLTSVLTLEGSSHALANTVLANTSVKDAEILAMDSMQSVTAKDVAQGASYLSIMEKNLEVLKAALN